MAMCVLRWVWWWVELCCGVLWWGGLYLIYFVQCASAFEVGIEKDHVLRALGITLVIPTNPIKGLSAHKPSGAVVWCGSCECCGCDFFTFFKYLSRIGINCSITYWMRVTSLNRCVINSSSVSRLHQVVYRSVEPSGILRMQKWISFFRWQRNEMRKGTKKKEKMLPCKSGAYNSIGMLQRCLELWTEKVAGNQVNTAVTFWIPRVVAKSTSLPAVRFCPVAWRHQHPKNISTRPSIVPPPYSLRIHTLVLVLRG